MPQRLACVLAASAMLAGATCDETVPDPASGNIERLADAALVTPDRNAFPRQTYVVLANPDLEQLRVFNAKTRVFERGPNAFFPLAVRTGPATLRLATTIGRDGELFALDSGTARVQLVRVSTGDDNFKSIGDGIEVAPGPIDLAAFALGAPAQDNQMTRIFVALGDAGAVQVLDVDPTTGEGTEVALISLPSGSHPTAIAVDPTGESVVVTDAVLSSVSILTVEPPAFERSVDVGGPTIDLSIGRVNPGDGLAPVAIVVREDVNQVAALRLFRPGYREERAELMGHVELPDLAKVAYVPDQSEDDIAAPRVCCPLVTGEDEATRAWAAVVTEFGELFYLRFDGLRDIDGGSDGRLGERGLFRLVNFFTGTPEVGPDFWSGEDDAKPVLQSDPLDNFGRPSFVPYLPPNGIDLTLTYEGRVLSDRVADYIDDGRIDLGLTGSDVRVGDALIVDVTEREGPCPDPFEREILEVDDDGVVFVGALSDADETCLNVGPRLRVDVRAANAFTVISNIAGVLGRRVLDTDGILAANEQIQTPGFLITLGAGAIAPTRDDVMVIEIVSNAFPVSMVLSQDPTSLTQGFGRGARLATSLVGGAVSVPGFVEGTFIGARRMFLATGAGFLIELNETEVDINSVVAHQ